MSKHTPGPWKMEQREGHSILPRWVVHSDLCDRICILSGRGGVVSEDEERANASLVTAAPEMLEACKAAVDAIENMIPESVGNDDADDVLGVLRAAIAKAKGGAA